jgi:hypothetical protein
MPTSLMTNHQRATAIRLRRDEGLSYQDIASAVDIASEKVVINFFKSLPNPPPKPTKTLKPKKEVRGARGPTPKPPLLPPHQLSSHCPVRRRAVSLETLQKLPQLTHQQLIDDLAQACRNTAMLAL